MDNRTNGVSVIITGDPKAVDRFCNDILENAPPASHIKSMEVIPRTVGNYETFSIAGSKLIENQITEVSPDIAVCTDCLEDMSEDPGRINYPLINCTNCGPRFTIIEDLPYDRPRTTMREFAMCARCSSEYNDILDRRFHAQPIACNSCGPVYSYRDTEKEVEGTGNVLAAIKMRIKAGKSVAIKGTGGYHLACDALNNTAVAELRKRKHRDAKPFAVMFSDINSMRKYCHIDKTEELELQSWRRPVVIVRQKEPLAQGVSNGLNTVGAMLPYMPFHYLLFREIETPLVMTSGNISDEPVITDDGEAEKKLMSVAGAVVSYNRKISNRADDSVVRITGGKLSLIRRSRGFVPRPIDLNFNVEGVLALGPEQKNCFTIGKSYQAITSQHIGDLKNMPSCEFFRESIDRFSSLFRFKPVCIATDLHPDYYSTIYGIDLGEKLGIPVIAVQHHHAHIVSAMAEHGLSGKVIGICFDGTGYGTDGNIWGGEFLIADTGEFERYAHFDYVAMPGGDRAVGEPWRMAFSYLYKYSGGDPDYKSLPVFRDIPDKSLDAVKEIMLKNINCPLTSGAGRLFDAVSALTGLCLRSTFDAEGPMRLESAAGHNIEGCYPFSFDNSINFSETLKSLIDDLRKTELPVISARFHNTLAQVVLEGAMRIRKDTGIDKVVLSGGVFQNKYLAEKSVHKLTMERFKVFLNHLVPSNDGGISLGQLVVASKKSGICV